MAWDQLYGESFTEGCIGTNKPDALLKYTPSASMLEEAARAKGGAWGSQVIGMSGGSSGGMPVLSLGKSETTLLNIEKNTSKIDTWASIDASIKSDLANGGTKATKSISVSGSGSNTDAQGKLAFLSNGVPMTYDPRTDTCEGLSFVEPNPDLKTTDKFYLGLTQNSPYRSEDKSPGYGWSNRAQVLQGLPESDNLNQLSKIEEQSYQDQQKATKDAEKTAKNTAEMSKDQKAAMAGGSYDASGKLSYGGGGDSGANWGTYGSRLGGSMGSFFGNSWISNGGIGSGATANGWGAAASNEAANGWSSPGIQYAGGGFSDHIAIFGEAGREAAVPISDRAAGLRILPQVMAELGVRRFASGGFSGGSPVNFSDVGGKIIIAPVYHFNGVGLSKEEILEVMDKNNQNLYKGIARRNALGKGRRSGSYG
jgi:hypothetical protein